MHCTQKFLSINECKSVFAGRLAAIGHLFSPWANQSYLPVASERPLSHIDLSNLELSDHESITKVAPFSPTAWIDGQPLKVTYA